MGLDAVLLGTAAAAIANPLFDGAQRSTLALGLGAGGLGAGRAYLGPHARAMAYDAGSAAMGCGAGVAEEFAMLRGLYKPDELAQRLDEAIFETERHPAFRETSPAGEALRRAHERAERARQEMEGPRRTLETAELRLRSFARAAIRSVTTRALTGTMDYATARRLISELAAGAGGMSVARPAPAPTGGPEAAFAPGRARDPAALVLRLGAESATAARFTAALNEASARLVACAMPA